MEEISPGLWHWTSQHPRINARVHSYLLRDELVLIDPIAPQDGLDWFASNDAVPEHVLLTNRHHDRDSWRLRELYGCTIHCIRNGLHELDGRGSVTAFDFGDELPGGVIVHEIDAICPDETALHIPAHHALACADGVVRRSGQDGLTFVGDHLMDNPEQTKAGLRAAYRQLLGLDFDVLLLAHGEPLRSGGKDALRAFVGQQS
jgi:hypothetical protein